MIEPLLPTLLRGTEEPFIRFGEQSNRNFAPSNVALFLSE